jgi:hypothetical protein
MCMFLEASVGDTAQLAVARQIVGLPEDARVTVRELECVLECTTGNAVLTFRPAGLWTP